MILLIYMLLLLCQCINENFQFCIVPKMNFNCLKNIWMLTMFVVIKFPAPRKTKFIKFPPSRAGKDVKCPEYARWGMFKLRFDWYIIVLVISNRPRASRSADLKLLTRLLPELYSTRSNYYYKSGLLMTNQMREFWYSYDYSGCHKNLIQ